MNEEIKKIWVKALKSGKYKQGKGKLSHAGRYCCLGVLCSIYAREKKIKLPNVINSVGSCANKVLPLDVEYWASCASDPSLIYNGLDFYISSLNDGTKSRNSLNFNQIADLIKQQL